MKYKEVMKQYNLGPNGGILTSLNLFATRFDQVLQLSTPHSFKNDAQLQALDMTFAWAGRKLAAYSVQVIGLCEKKRDPQPKHIVADTPGQIEIFTWSASGAIITEVPACP